ncbi:MULTISPECIES: DUF3108 domain-containing protein [Thermodesulfobacterium]|jgi:hypothetical protein|uniref:DUF3108 domain-containing protein n=1 Tax=Thermodesulfobacterium commune TaxID=1741 RepID=A0A101FK85_9BACT|nr:DUF3108 domain-containing protein [Thermodesulfobacterium sp.]KUJ98215.1 MAG: Uncharacterized protein XD42_0150 [Thermodesulfobacterium sp. 37_54]KUK19866.1 MAG: Uncharacterized protein XD55_0090 [Thermodesulfobacterium commune]KUK38557.1 MAG: Uncharacterized protein XD67_0154 [Thermodesulfobacterium commune]MBZ4681972.1 hypothetical protein [Thermodesulfobacterium sp.]MDK2861116.1 hypothetical protein [Thermodesulfobacterium sp.]
MKTDVKDKIHPFLSSLIFSLIIHISLFLGMFALPTFKHFLISYTEDFLDLNLKKIETISQPSKIISKKETSQESETKNLKEEVPSSGPQPFNKDNSQPSEQPSTQPDTNTPKTVSEAENIPKEKKDTSNKEKKDTLTEKAELWKASEKTKASEPTLSKDIVSLPKKLVYEIFYGPFKLGETIILIENSKYSAIVYTTGLGNVVYPYYAKWETWLDNQGNPFKTNIYSKDREKERKKSIFFDKERQVVNIKKGDIEKNLGKTFNVTYPIYDELTSFINSWLVDYLNQPKVEFPVYIKESRKFVKIALSKETSCMYEGKEEPCLELNITLPETSELLSRNRKVTVYLLKKEKYPIEIRGKLPLIGSLTGKLKEVVK